MKCERIIHKDLVPALKRMLAAKAPYVLDVMVLYTEHVLPMIPGGMTYRISSPSPSVKNAAKADVPTAQCPERGAAVPAARRTGTV